MGDKEQTSKRDGYEINMEHFRNNLPYGYELLRTTATQTLVQRIKQEAMESVSYGKARYITTSHGPYLSVPSEHIIKNDVTYLLSIFLNETGVPVYQKDVERISGSGTRTIWNKNKKRNIEKSFEIDYRDPNVLKLIIKDVYYYWENKNGKLVLADIR